MAVVDSVGNPTKLNLPGPTNLIYNLIGLTQVADQQPTLTNLSKLPVDPQQGYGFRSQPRPEYLNTLDDVIARLNDPRNAMFTVGMPWLYHGTKASQAMNILRKGFDPARIGENWGGAFGPLKGRSGPGVYLTDTPEKALGWSLPSGEWDKPAILRIFVPKKSILSTGPDVVRSSEGRAQILKEAQEKGFKAVEFPNEVVIPDPTTIPLRNIRPFPGPSKEDYERAQLLNIRPLGYGK